MTTFRTATAKRRSATALRVMAVIGIATSLAGCYTQRVAQETPYPNDYRERHPITLKDSERTVEIFIGRNHGGLTASQRADVLSFAQLWRREATSGVVVDVPQGGPTDRAAAESTRELQSILTASGVPRDAIYVRSHTPSNAALASIKIIYTKLAAEAGPCGLWPHDLGPSRGRTYTENRTYWNFGCASQHNLAAMVDNPADLVQPRGEASAYSPRRTVVLDKYRKGENPGGNYSGYDTAKISGLGK